MNDLTELLKKYYGYGINDQLGSTESTSIDGGLEQDMGLQNKSLLGSDRSRGLISFFLAQETDNAVAKQEKLLKEKLEDVIYTNLLNLYSKEY